MTFTIGRPGRGFRAISGTNRGFCLWVLDGGIRSIVLAVELGLEQGLAKAIE
jgi:hypothetical protein